MVRISKQAIVKSKKNYRLFARLMMLFNVHQKTIEVWINTNDVRMTTPDAVRIMMEELELTREELLIEEAVAY